MDPSEPFTLAGEVLACIVDGFATENIALPDRQYLHAGEIAIACEQVVVTILAATAHTPSLPDTTPHRTVQPRSVQLEAWITRCVPTVDNDGDQPSAPSLTAAAAVTDADLWTLVNLLVKGSHDGCYGRSCDRRQIGTGTVVGPQGAFTSVRVPLDLQLQPNL